MCLCVFFETTCLSHPFRPMTAGLTWARRVCRSALCARTPTQLPPPCSTPATFAITARVCVCEIDRGKAIRRYTIQDDTRGQKKRRLSRPIAPSHDLLLSPSKDPILIHIQLLPNMASLTSNRGKLSSPSSSSSPRYLVNRHLHSLPVCRGTKARYA